ncbi:hypothetical protein [Planobispora rosea]|uniref:hypothetical protein n=1 Tax=Planobispora rosea TaxID=35762 RepID=UPI0016717FD2|nr:hypothetical protein [Planobispora rosea]
MEISSGGLWGELCVPEVTENSPVRKICKRVQITVGDGDASRPIYLVPYDPTAADNQTKDEREYCTNILVQRVLVYAMSVLGRAEVPDFVRINGRDILREATFKISDYWQASELKKLERRIIQILHSTLNKGIIREKVQASGDWIEVHLESLDLQKAALNMLQRSHTETMAKALASPQLQLDEADN